MNTHTKQAALVATSKKLKTRLVAGEGDLPKMATNHNAPVKTTEKKSLKLKTRLVAGEADLPKMATNHNLRLV
ncbi:MAG: hypothetical protein ABI591_20415 [Kofleriaceae bacterium]